MKNTGHIPILIIAIVLISSNGWAQKQIGLLKTVSGNVTIQRDDTVIEANPGMHLNKTDTLITQANSTAGIIFTDGTTLAVGPDTEFNMLGYRFNPDAAEYDFALYLKKGAAIYTSGKIGKLSPDSVKLSTPRATVGVRGTRFILKVE